MLPKWPESLVENITRSRCVLFAGAGLSAWGRLPTWKALLLELVKKVAEEEPHAVDQGELHRMIDSGKLLEVAEYCKERLGPRLYSEVLTTHLRVDVDEIPAPHRIIVELPFASIITTNYDKLIETSYIRQGRGWPKAPTHQDTEDLSKLLFEGRFFILKAHGDIDRADSLILTTSDYRHAISGNPAFSAMFSALLLTKAILFIGYSLNDPDFRILMDRQLSVFRGSVPDRYALMSGVGSIESEILWRTARIRVVPYSNQSDIPDILEHLRQTVIRRRTKEPAPLDELFSEPATAPARLAEASGAGESIKLTIFLASSNEVREDRDAFEFYLRQQSDRFLHQGMFLKIVRWENFLSVASDSRLQDEYTRQIRACDIFVSLFKTRTGEFAEEEFNVAFDQFRKTGKPKIYVYFREGAVSVSQARPGDLTSPWEFKDTLIRNGHFFTPYDSVEQLQQHFKDQLEMLLGTWPNESA